MIEKGSYCLATKWSDGEAWDHWAVGFYEGEIFDGRFSVVDENGNRFRHGGFRRCQEISESQGRFLLENAKELESLGSKLWDLLPTLDKATDTGRKANFLKITKAKGSIRNLEKMSEFFCSTCRTVTLSASNRCSDCGKTMVVFNPCEHGRSLVSPANTWHQISEKWDDHPIFEEVSQKLYENNCCGAASHLNEFIRTLLTKVEDLEKDSKLKTPTPRLNMTAKQSLSALDLMVISDTLLRTLSIKGYESALGGYTKEAREIVANKVHDILNNINISFEPDEEVK